jgi:hypothetical protein
MTSLLRKEREKEMYGHMGHTADMTCIGCSALCKGGKRKRKRGWAIAHPNE